MINIFQPPPLIEDKEFKLEDEVEKKIWGCAFGLSKEEIQNAPEYKFHDELENEAAEIRPASEQYGSFNNLPPAYNPANAEVAPIEESKDTNKSYSYLTKMLPDTKQKTSRQKRFINYCLDMALNNDNSESLKKLYYTYILNIEKEIKFPFILSDDLEATIWHKILSGNNNLGPDIYNALKQNNHSNKNEFISTWVNVLIDTQNFPKLKELYLKLFNDGIESPEIEIKIWKTLINDNQNHGYALFAKLPMVEKLKDRLLQTIEYWMHTLDSREEVIRVNDSLRQTGEKLKMVKMIKASADNRIIAIEEKSKEEKGNRVTTLALQDKKVETFLKSSHSSFFKCAEPSHSAWDIHLLIKANKPIAKEYHDESKTEGERIINKKLSEDLKRPTHFRFK